MSPLHNTQLITVDHKLIKYLEDCGLILTLGAIETGEARADAGSVVAEASAGAVSASLVTVAIKRIGAGRALLQVAGGAAVAGVTEATHVLHGIPRLRVCAASLGSQMLLRPASAAVIAIVGAEGTLASNTIVAREAVASTGGTVAGSLVGALSPRVKVIGIHDVSHPSEVLGAGALRAIRAGPFRLSVETSKALAVVVCLAGSVVGTVVLAHTSLAVSSLVKGNLSPRLSLVRRSSRRHRCRLT